MSTTQYWYKQITKYGEGSVLHYRIIPINKHRRKWKNAKSSSGKQHYNNCYRQDLPMNADISGQKFEKTGYLHSFNNSPHHI